MTTQEQINSFVRYATAQLAGGPVQMSVDELFDRWRHENLTPEEFAANVAAIGYAIDDMHNGDVGRDASEIERELRESLELRQSE